MARNVKEWLEQNAHVTSGCKLVPTPLSPPDFQATVTSPSEGRSFGVTALEAQADAATPSTVAPPAESAIDRIRAGAAKARIEDSRNLSAAARGAITSVGHVAIDQFGVARFMTVIGERFVPMRLDSQDFRDFAQGKASATGGKPLGKDAITSLIEVLRAGAMQTGAKVEVHVRVATQVSTGGTRCYLIDLSSHAGEIVLVSPKGWKVFHNNGWCAFLGGGGTLPIPQKPTGVDDAYEIVRDFLEQSGVPVDLVFIVLVAMCDWLRADTPHPVLNIIGAAGSGKSSLARAIISIIDPSQSGKLPEMRIEEEHIAASAQSRHILVADNASYLSRDAQDLLCRCVYGYETSQRRLYTQNEVERLPIHNPVIITSILPAITAADLHDRAVRVAFRPRRQFVAGGLEFERGRVFGALLTLLSAGMGRISVGVSSPHRLVEFALLGEGIAEALGHHSGYFSDLLNDASRVTASDYSEGDDLILALRAVLSAGQKNASAAEVLPPPKSWANGSYTIKRNNGTYVAAFGAAPLLAEINRCSALGNNAGSYPRTPRALAAALELKLPVLSALGIRVEKRVLKHARQTIWAFEWR